MKHLATLVAAAFLATFVPITSTTTASAAAATALPITSFADIVVDAAHGKVFVSGGGSVVVTDLSGTVAGAISGISGARQMTLSPDGSELVVANGDGLTVVDPATAVVDRTISTGVNSCPDAVASSAGLVFYTYGDCAGGTPGLGAVDLTNDTLTTGLSTGTVTVQSARLVSASAADVLALTAGPSLVILAATGGDTPSTTVRASSPVIGVIRDVALNPDGSRVVIAGPETSQHRVLNTSDFGAVEMTPYSKSGTSNALALRADGELATGYAKSGADAYTYSKVGGATRGALDLAPTGSTLVQRGLAFGQNKLYGVIVSAGSYQLVSAAPDGPADIRISSNVHIYPYGATATVTIVLHSPTLSTKVSLWANTTGHTPHLVKVAYVDPVTRKVVLKVPSMKMSTVFTAKFGGDDRYQRSSSAGLRIQVRFKVTITSSSKSMVGSYHRLPASPAPLITGTLSPGLQGVCIRVSADVKDGSLWNIGLIKCLRTTSTGRVGVKLIGFPRGIKLRIVMKVDSTATNYSSYAAIYYVTLT